MTHACICGCNNIPCTASVPPNDEEPDPWKPIGPLVAELVKAAVERRTEPTNEGGVEPKPEAHDD